MQIKVKQLFMLIHKKHNISSQRYENNVRPHYGARRVPIIVTYISFKGII